MKYMYVMYIYPFCVIPTLVYAVCLISEDSNLKHFSCLVWGTSCCSPVCTYTPIQTLSNKAQGLQLAYIIYVYMYHQNFHLTFLLTSVVNYVSVDLNSPGTVESNYSPCYACFVWLAHVASYQMGGTIVI